MLKTKRIGLIVTKEEKDWVVLLAKLEGGLSQASLIRRLIHKAAEEYNLTANSNNISLSPDAELKTTLAAATARVETSGNAPVQGDLTREKV